MARFEPPLAPGVEGSAGLRDGTEVFVRVARGDDKDLLLHFLRTISPESLELRFFGAMRPETACDMLLIEGPSLLQLSLIALSRDSRSSRIVGQAEYVRSSSTAPTAEVAFLMGDDWRGRGLGTILLHRLARAAVGLGIKRFEARVLPQNLEMLEVFRESGYATQEKHAADEVRIIFPITEEGVASSMGVPRILRGDRFEPLGSK